MTRRSSGRRQQRERRAREDDPQRERAPPCERHRHGVAALDGAAASRPQAHCPPPPPRSRLSSGSSTTIAALTWVARTARLRHGRHVLGPGEIAGTPRQRRVEITRLELLRDELERASLVGAAVRAHLGLEQDERVLEWRQPFLRLLWLRLGLRLRARRPRRDREHREHDADDGEQRARRRRRPTRTTAGRPDRRRTGNVTASARQGLLTAAGFSRSSLTICECDDEHGPVRVERLRRPLPDAGLNVDADGIELERRGSCALGNTRADHAAEHVRRPDVPHGPGLTALAPRLPDERPRARTGA